MTHPTPDMPDPWYHGLDLQSWFELSYAQYLTIPRSVLEAMPSAWQQQFARLLFELDETIDWRPEGRYWVELRDPRGRIQKDPLREYRHMPRAAIPFKVKS